MSRPNVWLMCHHRVATAIRGRCGACRKRAGSGSFGIEALEALPTDTQASQSYWIGMTRGLKTEAGTLNFVRLMARSMA